MHVEIPGLLVRAQCWAPPPPPLANMITTPRYCHMKIEQSLELVKQALSFFSYACGNTRAFIKSLVLAIPPPPLRLILSRPHAIVIGK